MCRMKTLFITSYKLRYTEHGIAETVDMNTAVCSVWESSCKTHNGGDAFMRHPRDNH